MKLLSLLYEGVSKVQDTPSLSCLAFYNDTFMFFRKRIAILPYELVIA